MDERLPQDDEIDLLDLLVTVAENIKLLILGPLLATDFAQLLFVFACQAFRNASVNPESAAKIVRIRQALGLKA